AAAAAAAAANAAATGSTAIVTAGNLNVRRGDNPNTDIVASISRDTVVTLIGRNSNSNWAFIRTPSGQEGWVNANYLRYDPGIYNLPVRNADGSLSGGSVTTSSATSTAATLTSVGNIITVSTDVLSVYSGPGTNYDSFAMVFWGQTLILIGRSADGAWAKVQDATGAQGWVSAASITSSVPIAQVGVAN
ncbi:MAG: SH3 domain-containing protein, partial [Anaerolineales bacterium]|nr:SH3 domain-containing protein [Anaerolineales bacterium]